MNKTRLKEDIINHFFYYGIQEQSSGTNTVLVLPEGIKYKISLHMYYNQ